MIQQEYQLKKAADFEAQGKFLHAIQIYHGLIKENPGYTLAYVRLSTLYDRMDNIEAAVNLLRNYLESVTDDKDIRLFLGQIFLKNQFWEEAVETLSLLVLEEQPIVSFFLGYAHFMMKEFEISRMHFSSFLANNENSEYHFESYLYLAKIGNELGLFDEALEFAKKAEKIYNNWETNLIIGIVYFNQGMYYHAVIAFEKAIKLNEKELSLYEWTGKANLKLGDYVNANKYLLKFVNSADGSAETYSFLALSYLNLHKVEEAILYFDLALSLDPGNQIAIEGKKKCST